MQITKKIYNWVFVLSVIISFSFFRPINAAEEKEPFLVGFAQDDMSSEWRAQQVYQLEKALQKYPSIKFIYTDAKGQVAKGIQDIEDLYDRGIDLLLTSPRNPTLASPVISKIYRSGIPVVLLTRQMQGDDFTSYIGPDDVEIARMAADTLAEELQGKGRVLMIHGLPNATTAVNRALGFQEQLRNHKGISLAPVLMGNYDRAEAIKVTGKAIEDGVKFDAIFAQSDSMAVGARIALKAHGIDPKTIPMVSIDYISEARTAIQNNLQLASFTYPLCSAEAAEVIWDIFQGKKVPKKIMVQSQKVTKDNVKKVETIF